MPPKEPLKQCLSGTAVVTVADDGRTARGRGLELRTVGVNNQYAEWGEAIFENTYVKQDGVWKLDEIHVKSVKDIPSGANRVTLTATARSPAPLRRPPPARSPTPR